MQVVVFGKDNCALCEAAKKRIGFLIEKMGAGGKVRSSFVDVESVDGRAEAAFNDVFDAIPVTIITNDEQTLARWEGEIPNAEELRSHFESVAGASTD